VPFAGVLCGVKCACDATLDNFLSICCVKDGVEHRETRQVKIKCTYLDGTFVPCQPLTHLFRHARKEPKFIVQSSIPSAKTKADSLQRKCRVPLLLHIHHARALGALRPRAGAKRVDDPDRSGRIPRRLLRFRADVLRQDEVGVRYACCLVQPLSYGPSRCHHRAMRFFFFSRTLRTPVISSWPFIASSPILRCLRSLLI
jgi:hypothetical protein